MIVKSFEGKLAVVTGGGTGMGRELAVQLASEGCSVAICDVSAENMAETQRLCEKAARAGTRVSAHLCDVADERQVIAFKDAVVAAHQADHVDLLFNNAGIGGGASVVAGDRVEWERTFGVCWYGAPSACAGTGCTTARARSCRSWWRAPRPASSTPAA
jgi:NAD(P)-dependent dehydrogenase (short-subunit alcohol dehydrogenase family)